MAVNKDFFVNDLGLQFFSSDQGIFFFFFPSSGVGRQGFTGADRYCTEEDLDGLKGWSKRLACDAVIHTVTCVGTGNTSSANVTRGETSGCTS